MKSKLKLNFLSWWVRGWLRKKTKLMIYSTLVEIEVEVELGNIEVFEILQY